MFLPHLEACNRTSQFPINPSTYRSVTLLFLPFGTPNSCLTPGRLLPCRVSLARGSPSCDSGRGYNASSARQISPPVLRAIYSCYYYRHVPTSTGDRDYKTQRIFSGRVLSISRLLTHPRTRKGVSWNPRLSDAAAALSGRCSLFARRFLRRGGGGDIRRIIYSLASAS